MKKPEVVVEVQPSDLEGLPGIGVVRRAALEVAGITTRAALGRATVEQLISITGIQRAYAIKVLDLARAVTDDLTTVEVPAMDEALPNADGNGGGGGATEPSAPESEPPFDLDIAIFKTTTALADASRRYQESASLSREFIRFAKLLARLPETTLRVSKKRKSRIAARLDRVTVRLEKAASRSGKTSKAVSGKLREALKSDRYRITDIVAAKPRSRSKGKK